MSALAIEIQRPTHIPDSAIDVEASLAETIASYDQSAETYADRYDSLDMSGYINRFLSLRPHVDAPVLDAGCGSGRDCLGFLQRGIAVVGVDLSRQLMKIAAQKSGAPCVLADVRALPFADGTFSGMWASASLVHLPPQEITRALAEARRVLVASGVMFISVTDGQDAEWRPDETGGRRWFRHHDPAAIRRLIEDAGLDVLHVAVEPGLVHGQWINAFARRK